MISPFYFVISPKDGSLYKTDPNGLIVSSSIQNHRFVNRIAEVDQVPLMYNGPIASGDTIVVHHNIFRKFLDVKGVEKFSTYKVTPEIYRAPIDTVFAYKKPGQIWKSVDGFLFVSPVDNFDDYTPGKEKALYGDVRIASENSRIPINTRICFKPHSEYEFNIEGQKMYRVRESAVCLMFQK